MLLLNPIGHPRLNTPLGTMLRSAAAVAAAVNHTLPGCFRNFKSPGLVFVQRPEVVLFVETGGAPRRPKESWYF